MRCNLGYSMARAWDSMGFEAGDGGEEATPTINARTPTMRQCCGLAEDEAETCAMK